MQSKKKGTGRVEGRQRALSCLIKHLGPSLVHVMYLLHCKSLVSPDQWLVSPPICPLLEKPTTEVTCTNLHIHVRCFPRRQQGPALCIMYMLAPLSNSTNLKLSHHKFDTVTLRFKFIFGYFFFKPA